MKSSTSRISAQRSHSRKRASAEARRGSMRASVLKFGPAKVKLADDAKRHQDESAEQVQRDQYPFPAAGETIRRPEIANQEKGGEEDAEENGERADVRREPQRGQREGHDAVARQPQHAAKGVLR